MARSTPVIRDNMLLIAYADQTLSLVAGSESWFAWLQKETTTIFAFQGLASSYTARKERAGNQRGGEYWKAYRSYQGKLYRAYLGKARDLTLARLHEVALVLERRIQGSEQSKADNFKVIPHSNSLTSENEAVMPLLETRLHPPRLPAQLVKRSRLLRLLEAGQEQKLTLLQASAGCGKTTLVTQWIAYRHSQAVMAEHSPEPVAWLSLERGDNDPLRFWSSLIKACQSFQAEIGKKALAQLFQLARLALSPSALETVLTLLLNDLMRNVQAGVLVLEDYHLIEHFCIHETLTFFIEHLPDSLHILILTRSEPPLPLARWRARGDLLEIFGSHLRFSHAETASFLSQLLPATASDKAVSQLEVHLDGWAAGLRLFVLSLQGQVAPLAVEDALARLQLGSLTTRTQRAIQEYFLSEVLSAQPEPLQLFLLQTSLLSRLTGSLCAAVTGRQESAMWLEVVERSGFFLEALDSAGEWYRYHALFAEIMQAEALRRLGEEELQGLQAKAARWYEEHNMLVEAIEAILAAGAFEHAAQLIERLHERSYFSESHTVRRWLPQLPTALLRAHPALCFRYAQARLFPEEMSDMSLELACVKDLLQMAEEGWRRQEKLYHVGMLYALRATYAFLNGDTTTGIPYAHQALQLFPLTVELPSSYFYARHDWRCICLCALAVEAMQAGSFEEAYQHLLEAYTFSLQRGDGALRPAIGRMLGDVCLELGELHRAGEYFQQAIDMAREFEGGEGVPYVASLSGLAHLSYEWNQLEKMEQQLHEIAPSSERGLFLRWGEEIRTKSELLRLKLLRAREEGALVKQELEALLVRLQASPLTSLLIPEVLMYLARSQIKDGDLTAASRTLASLADLGDNLTLLQQQDLELLHARLRLAQGQAKGALPILARLLSTARQGKQHRRALEGQLLIALAYSSLQQKNQAQQYLSAALVQARAEGFVRLFLDEGEPMRALLRSLLPALAERPLRAYVRSLLQAFASALAGKTAAHGQDEQLTAQEMRVLALLVAGRSKAEIAESLIISVNTVKGHVKNLYRKLAVTNRLEAGEVARHLKLL
ncbi:hypothetical protein EPA93_12280 [Ktedonosporobacter rubrisoli]|uniref:HTH luxR-type domain-containing protein n=1 Tax=Ktedonosporobacter rubrisoli TaxID=2509675 RepID=A0A4P6JNP5_KTERU|nr:LuxR C-terminal-related transcriptional regulator [Ktedonosporobacter rubrisoli]QBD76740.1 hypothetical protein EPA93_12280 [Ktedonosporobacter rubrisoli]